MSWVVKPRVLRGSILWQQKACFGELYYRFEQEIIYYIILVGVNIPTLDLDLGE